MVPGDGWQWRPGRGCVPVQEFLAGKAHAPHSTWQGTGSSLTSLWGPCLSREGLGQGSWGVLTRELAQQDQCCTLLLPTPCPASASPSLLLIWFLSRMITFSSNKTRVHFLPADCPHTLIPRYRSQCPVQARGLRRPPHRHLCPYARGGSGHLHQPHPGSLPAQPVGRGCSLPSP